MSNLLMPFPSILAHGEGRGEIDYFVWTHLELLPDYDDAMRILERPIISLKDWEDSEASFLVEGSRSLAHKIAKHRVHHHLKNSQCYIRATHPEIMIPPSIKEDIIKRSIFLSAIENCFYDFKYLTSVGVRIEDAKFVLPDAILTRFKITASLENWRKFLELSGMDWELTLVKNSILYILSVSYLDFLEPASLFPLEYADIVSNLEFGDLDGN